MKFAKMHGLGNDFVLVDDTALALREEELLELGRRICDRHFGIGADGLILVQPSDVADVRMRVINSDATEADMCGNGIRCFSVFVRTRRLSDANPLRVETRPGVMVVKIGEDTAGNYNVRVDMGVPRLERADVPMTGEGSAMNVPVQVDGEEFVVTGVSMGNPHGVIFVDDVEAIDLARVGPLLCRHPVFPRKANIHFVQRIGPDELKMRVCERGAGITMACGTGACAVTVASTIHGFVNRKAKVHLPGGTLMIEWAEDGHVFMTGPAVEVFEGDIEIA